jgi:hypothetical protein
VGWDYGLLSGIFMTASVTTILALQFVLYAGNKPAPVTTAAAGGKKAKEGKKDK